MYLRKMVAMKVTDLLIMLNKEPTNHCVKGQEMLIFCSQRFPLYNFKH